MTSLLAKHLHRFAFTAMMGVVLALALLTSPSAGASSGALSIIAQVTAEGVVAETQRPIQPHNVDDCVVCKGQTLIGNEEKQQSRVNALIVTLLPPSFVAGFTSTRAPPVSTPHTTGVKLGFDSRGPPSVS